MPTPETVRSSSLLGRRAEYMDPALGGPVPRKGLGASSGPGAHAVRSDRIFDNLEQSLLDTFGCRLDDPSGGSDYLEERGAVGDDDGNAARHGLKHGEPEPLESARLACRGRSGNEAGELFVGGIGEPQNPAGVIRELSKGLPTEFIEVEVARRVRSDDHEGMGKTAIDEALEGAPHGLQVLPRTDRGSEDQVGTIVARAFSNERAAFSGATGMEQLVVHAERVHVDPFWRETVVVEELLLEVCAPVTTCVAGVIACSVARESF